MVKTQLERLAIMEQKLNQNSDEHKSIMEKLEALTTKLDCAIEKKADKSEVIDMRNKQWMIIMAVITSFIGLIIYELQRPR